MISLDSDFAFIFNINFISLMFLSCIGADVLPDGAAATPAVVLVRVFAALTEVEVWHISLLQYYHH